MGGRGGQSGMSAVTLASLVQAWDNAAVSGGANWQQNGDYTDNNNPELVKYQGQEDDKTASFLHGTEQKVDFADYADGYVFYDLPLNKLLLRLGVKGKPVALSDADFDAYVQQTGQQVYYRGWSGRTSAQRMIDAQYNHVGNGIYGDGYYFTPWHNTASSYARASGGSNGVVQRMALAPSARVISYSDLQQRMGAMSSKLQRSLGHTGGGSGRTYSPNDGEAQAALKLGYNVVDMGSGYMYAVTRDAFIVSRRLTR